MRRTIHWKDYQQVGWAIGQCPKCKQVEAVQIRDVIDVTAYYFIPVRRTIVGKDCVCDFCERPLVWSQVSQANIAMHQWMPADGLPALLKSLGVKQKVAPLPTTDERLHSLLSAVQEASSLKNVSITPGLIVGGLAGITLGIPLGLAAFAVGLRLGVTDRFGHGFLGAAMGAVIGAIVGSATYGWLIRGRTATKRLVATCRRYGLDGTRLCELSAGYKERVQHAARASRDDSGFGQR
jgi:hypothetical protein